MLEQEETQELAETKLRFTERFNFEMLIAACAVLISIASFYATFLQANAAEKQVTAMTLPLMNFLTGNVHPDGTHPQITYVLANKGVGPAKIETFLLKYNNSYFSSRKDYLNACCESEYKEYKEQREKNLYPAGSGMITSDPNQQIIPSGEEVYYLQLPRHEVNEPLYKKLDEVRGKTSVAVCYCSLLDNCYWLTENNQISETPSCKE